MEPVVQVAVVLVGLTHLQPLEMAPQIRAVAVVVDMGQPEHRALVVLAS